MMGRKFLFYAFCLVLASCQNTEKNNEIQVNADDVQKDEYGISNTSGYDSLDLGEGLPIYYNMYLTVELSSLFETAGASFEPQLLNPVENVSRYLSSSEEALNLGVYAVNLSYCRVFEQFQKAGNYFSAMYTLAEDLGIPEEYFYSTADRLEKNISNKDSLNKIANEVYVATRDYLTANERESASALIILGGWVEAIYLASNIFEVTNDEAGLEYLMRLEEQKISLQNLINLLEKYKNDEVIGDLLKELKDLQPLFNNFKVQPDKLDASVEQLEKINKRVSKIRTDIVS